MIDYTKFLCLLPLALGCTSTDAFLGLDYTAYVEGGVQVSGLAVDGTGTRGALVTDFEQLVLFDPSTATATGTFDVQFGDLPRQGSSEAVAFAGGLVWVLYPDEGVVRGYTPEGTATDEWMLGDERWAGAMASRDDVLVVATAESEPRLIAYDWRDGTRLSTTPIVGLTERLEGLGSDIKLSDGWVGVTASGALYTISDSGEAVQIGVAADVAEPSAVESFVSDPLEAETSIAVADDDDAYNDTEGPIRLYNY